MRNLLHLPKAELHVHIEAIAKIETLREFADKYSVEKSYIDALEYPKENDYADLKDFFEHWHIMNSLLRDPQDFERVTYEYLEELAGLNTRYVELNVNVLRQEAKGIKSQKLFQAIKAAQDSAEKDFGIISRTLASFSRAYSVREGKYVVDLAEKFRNLNIVGIDIAGDEKTFPNKNFIEVYKYAKSKNIPRTAHAGESAMQDSIKDAVINMDVTRIGHGVDAIYEQEVLELLIDHQVNVELCVSSNIALGVYSDIETHPGKNFIQLGIPVSINTDDPSLFGVNIGDEYELVASAWDLADSDIQKIYQDTISASFAEEDVKQELVRV